MADQFDKDRAADESIKGKIGRALDYIRGKRNPATDFEGFSRNPSVQGRMAEISRAKRILETQADRYKVPPEALEESLKNL